MNPNVSCAFNVFNAESIRGIAEAASELSTKVYLQTSSSVVRTFGATRLRHLISLLTDDLHPSLLTLHLDHCSDISLISACIENGWNSVMIDGSSFSLTKNIEMTRRVVEIAHRKDVRVEGELGVIGGEEDGSNVEEDLLVHPEDVEIFVKETNIDFLAVGIGNKHGYYHEAKYKLHFDLLSEVHSRIPQIPLVLHGGTGIKPEDMREAVRLGVRKINFSTELKDCFLKSATEHAMGKNRYDMSAYHQTVVTAIKVYAIEKIGFFSGVIA